MILTDEFCKSQPHVTVSVLNQDGALVEDRVMAGQCGMFAGMIYDAIQDPRKKALLDSHIGNTRFCGKTHAQLLSELRSRSKAAR